MQLLGPGVDAGHFLGERDVGLVFDVDDAVVGVFAVKAAFFGFVAVLEPVVADEVGLAQGEGDIAREGIGAILLGFDHRAGTAGVGQAAVLSAKGELADDQRFAEGGIRLDDFGGSLA